jgi:inward rectifier potassium channel
MKKNEHAVQEVKPIAELGLDRTAQKGRQRTINEDGSYNVDRVTGKVFGNFNPYHWVISTTWTTYWFVMLSFYAVMNVLFATAYHQIGIDQLSGIPAGSEVSN